MGSLLYAQEEDEVELLFTDEYARVLHAAQTPFERSAQFDWSLGWFRYRGLSPEHKAYFINNAKVNSLIDRRIDWNRWGGLNDVTRYPEQALVATPSLHPAQVGGMQRIETNASKQRSPLRLTLSSANRSYRQRIMATVLLDLKAYTLMASGSWRSAATGYYDNSPYQSRSGFLQLSKTSDKGSFRALAMTTNTSRVSPEAHTEEVWSLTNGAFNGSWGYEGQKISPLKPRVHKHQFYQIELGKALKQHDFSAGLFMYTSSLDKHNLSYQMAPSPFMTYYRYLPSYYRTSPFLEARLIQQHGLYDGIDLERLRTANTNSTYARYALIADVKQNNQAGLQFSFSHQDAARNYGVWMQFTKERANFFQRVEDVLDGSYVLNRDLYAQLNLDLRSRSEKKKGDRMTYDYALSAAAFESALFYAKEMKRQRFDAQLFIRNHSASRLRLAVHELYMHEPNESPAPASWDASFTARASYFPSGSTEWRFRTYLGRLHQSPESFYVNTRYSQYSDRPLADSFMDIGVTYFYKRPGLLFRVQTSYLNHVDGVSNTYFYAETGEWQDLVTQRLRGLRRRSLEWVTSLQLDLSSEISLEGVGYILVGSQSTPEEAHLYRDPENASGRLQSHRLALDPKLTYALDGGPNRAVSLGLSYKSPRYWNVTLKSNYLSHAFLGVSWPQQDLEFGKQLVHYGLRPPDQEQLKGLFYINLLLSKSWRMAKGYLQLFASISNVSNTIQPIAGFASSRLIDAQSYAQNQVNQPVFASRYWQSVGRTYFINLSYSFNAL